MEMSHPARAYWIGVVATGVAVLAFSATQWDLPVSNVWRFLLYLCGAVATSRFKIRLPGAFGTVSMNYLFTVVGLYELNLPAAMLIGLASVLAQTLFRSQQRPKWEQVAFSLMAIPMPILLADQVLHIGFVQRFDPTACLALVSASMVYFLVNTWTVAGIVGLTTTRSIVDVWKESFLWTSPQYLVGGTIASGLHLLNRYVSWQGLLLAIPPLYLVYRSYAVYLGRVDQQQKHIAEMAQLHLRTIEALALAIDAKDDTTAAHLRRVQVYAAAIARDLKLPGTEMQALEAAAMLHDIGKLAVPEYIISKPGRLTPEEFEKMKIHPIVGAEILARVNFPYPVAPIVRSHHEKWDGSGYPDGLSGEEIPIGARILSAVDCLDALASDRQYRRALPLDEAMELVEKESGKAFDPKVVAILRERYRDLEAEAKMGAQEGAKLSNNITVKRGGAPAAGFAESAPSPDAASSSNNFTLAIADARREVQLLVEITNDLGNTLSLDETLALLAVRLGKLVPHDSIVIYVVEENRLTPSFVKGESFRLLSSLQIPVGQGLSGWVAENDRPIVNGNPAVEPGYLNDPQKITPLRSAIAVPLRGKNEIVGVLALYSLHADAFNQDHLRVLNAIRSKAGIAIENSLRFERAKNAAENDELTGLLNAGALFRILEVETSACHDTGGALGVVVLDLDGFKRANDVYGHLTGNRILQEVASGLRRLTRPNDFVARMGGDEFVVLIPGADRTTTQALLARIAELGPRASEIACGEPVVTISAGIANSPVDGLDPEVLLEKADQRMYEAKRAKSSRLVA